MYDRFYISDVFSYGRCLTSLRKPNAGETWRNSRRLGTLQRTTFVCAGGTRAWNKDDMSNLFLVLVAIRQRSEGE